MKAKKEMANMIAVLLTSVLFGPALIGVGFVFYDTNKKSRNDSGRVDLFQLR